MIENKKYYNGISWKFVLSLAMLSALITYFIPFDSGNVSFKLFTTLDWILIMLIVTFNTMVFVTFIRVKQKKEYIYFKDNELYVKRGFAKTKTISLFSDYVCKERKNEITYIMMKDTSDKPIYLLPKSYEITLEEVRKLLESRKAV